MAVFDINPGGSPQAAGDITFGVEGEDPTFTLDSDGVMTVAGTLTVADQIVSPLAMVENGNNAASVGGMENLSRFGNDELSGTSGRLWLNYCNSQISGEVSEIVIASSATAGVAVTFARLGLFLVEDDDSLTLVARTANDATIGAGSFTTYTRAFATAGGYPASYALVAGQRYALAMLQVAGTAASWAGKFIVAAESLPVPYKYIDGQAEIAASYADAALSIGFTTAYMRVNP